eukprot:6213769-Pleurochrysis_carterae.AAC.3
MAPTYEATVPNRLVCRVSDACYGSKGTMGHGSGVASQASSVFRHRPLASRVGHHVSNISDWAYRFEKF